MGASDPERRSTGDVVDVRLRTPGKPRMRRRANGIRAATRRLGTADPAEDSGRLLRDGEPQPPAPEPARPPKGAGFRAPGSSRDHRSRACGRWLSPASVLVPGRAEDVWVAFAIWAMVGEALDQRVDLLNNLSVQNVAARAPRWPQPSCRSLDEGTKTRASQDSGSPDPK